MQCPLNSIANMPDEAFEERMDHDTLAFMKNNKLIWTNNKKRMNESYALSNMKYISIVSRIMCNHLEQEK